MNYAHWKWYGKGFEKPTKTVGNCQSRRKERRSFIIQFLSYLNLKTINWMNQIRSAPKIFLSASRIPELQNVELSFWGIRITPTPPPRRLENTSFTLWKEEKSLNPKYAQENVIKSYFMFCNAVVLLSKNLELKSKCSKTDKRTKPWIFKILLSRKNKNYLYFIVCLCSRHWLLSESNISTVPR